MLKVKTMEKVDKSIIEKCANMSEAIYKKEEEEEDA